MGKGNGDGNGKIKNAERLATVETKVDIIASDVKDIKVKVDDLAKCVNQFKPTVGWLNKILGVIFAAIAGGIMALIVKR